MRIIYYVVCVFKIKPTYGQMTHHFYREILILHNFTDLILYSWQEKAAEVEFLKVLDGNVIPIEVKSGQLTKAKSLGVFREKYHPNYEVIFSAKNMESMESKKRRYLPLYLTSWFPLKNSK